MSRSSEGKDKAEAGNVDVGYKYEARKGQREAGERQEEVKEVGEFVFPVYTGTLCSNCNVKRV